MHAFHAEVIACLQGIQAAIGLGIGQLILETDAQKVVSAINTTNYADTATGHLVEEKVLGRLEFYESSLCVQR